VVQWLAATHRGLGPGPQPLLSEDGRLEGRHVATPPIAPGVVAEVNSLVASWLTAPPLMSLVGAWDAAAASRLDLDAAAQGLGIADLRRGVCAACPGG
jgi:hypothetical protein